jgi:hypothetical protein
MASLTEGIVPRDLEGLIDIARTKPDKAIAQSVAESVAQVAETTGQPEQAEVVRAEAEALPEDEIADLTEEDVRNSETLQKLGALPGDRVVNQKLVRLVSDPPRGEVLTMTDILNSPTLQELGAEAGDSVEDGLLIKAGKNEPLRNFLYHHKQAESALENFATYAQSVAPIPQITFDITDPLNFIDIGFDDPEYQEFLKLSPAERRDKMAEDKLKELEDLRRTFQPEMDLAGMAGTVVGTTDVATLAVPLGSTIKGMTTIGGILGGAYNVGNQLAETGDVQVETLPGDVALGMLGGGVFGVGSKGIKVAAQQITKPAKTRSAVKQTERIEEALNKKVAEGVPPVKAFEQVQAELGISRKEILELSSAAGRKIKVPQSADKARKLIMDDEIVRDSALLRQISTTADKYLGALSTRIKNISMTAFGRLRRMEADLHIKTAQSLTRVEPFLRTMKGLSADMQRKVGVYLANGDYDLASKMLRDIVPDIDDQLAAVRSELNLIKDELTSVGYTFEAVENYFPRMVKDYENYSKYLTGEEADAVSRALREFAKKRSKTVKELSREERQEIIQSVLEGRVRGKGNKLVQERKIQRINSDQYDFYESPAEALQKYIRYARNDIERRKFFKKDNTVENELGQFDADESIAKLLENEEYRGRLSKRKIEELGNLLQARFVGGSRNMGSTASALRDLGYAGTIANPISALKQMTDLFNVGAIYGYRNVFKSMFGAKEMKLIDAGIEKATNELQEISSLSRMLNILFKASGFEMIDTLGKETAINAGLSRLRNLSQTAKGRAKLRQQYGDMFGNEFDAFVDDLQRGDITGNVKIAGFSLLADLQPIARSEMPEAWLRGGDAARMAYMLKSFTLKQLDVLRRETVQEWKDGNRMEAIKRASVIAASLGTSGVAVGTVADVLMGREVRGDDIPDKALWSILGVYGLNQYVAQRYFAQGDVIQGIQETLLPATNILEALFDLPVEVFKENPDFGEQLKAFPVLGPLAYAWWGGGAEKYNERQRKRVEKERREAREAMMRP